MSILAARSAIDSSLIVGGTVFAVSTGLSMWLVLRGSVVGPPRVARHEPLSLLLAVTLMGIGLWVMVPAVYATARGLPVESAPEPPVLAPPSTSPVASGPSTVQTGAAADRRELSPREQVILSIASGTLVAVILMIVNRMIRPGGLARAGFSVAAFGRGVGIGLLAGGLILPLMFGVTLLTQKVWEWIGYEHPNLHEMLRILSDAQDPALRAMIVFSAVLVAPVFEELLFRGHVQTLLAAAFTRQFSIDRAAARWGAIVVTSILFALVHGALWMMPPIFFLSLCLGYVYERTANLWAPMLVHLMFNAVNVSAFLFAR